MPIKSFTMCEIDLIKKALNYYGDKIADSQGYSNGEPYWDLIAKIDCALNSVQNNVG